MSDKICKTIHQYNKEPLSPEDMGKLQEIADDYCKVKNYVYQRYGGIRSIAKLYPGYTVQNEMTSAGLRAQLNMPSVYFYLAVFEALGDIKTQWAKVKNDILAAINKNERFTPQDKHYLRFVIKISDCFEKIINGKTIEVSGEMAEQYARIIADRSGGKTIEADNLNRYLCRQVRRKLRSLHTEKADGFAIAERAYRYGMHENKKGIFLSTKEKRKRIFVPLTDENEYRKQLYIKLLPEKSGIEIAVPIEVKVRRHEDYQKEIGVSVGVWQMFTTDSGNVYGERLGELNRKRVDFLEAADRSYRREKKNNPGREKYKARKQRMDAGFETYVNQEINRMIAQEKPSVIYIPRLPNGTSAGHNRRINYAMSVWKRGFIRERLTLKCRENSIEIVEVIGKAISTQCSMCGAQGKYEKEKFCCHVCGYEADKKMNAARNAISRGRTGQRLNSVYVPREETRKAVHV